MCPIERDASEVNTKTPVGAATVSPLYRVCDADRLSGLRAATPRRRGQNPCRGGRPGVRSGREPWRTGQEGGRQAAVARTGLRPAVLSERPVTSGEGVEGALGRALLPSLPVSQTQAPRHPEASQAVPTGPFSSPDLRLLPWPHGAERGDRKCRGAEEGSEDRPSRAPTSPSPQSRADRR